MGAQKLLLPFAGTTVVGALAATLGAAGVSPILLVTAPPPAGSELRRWAAGAGIAGLLTAANPAPEDGMLSTVTAGIAALGGASALAARSEVLLISPADLPALRAATVTRLLAAMAASGASLALPTSEGRRGHPLAIAARLIPEILQLDPAVGLRGLRDRHLSSLLELDCGDPGCVTDVDTPEDYQRARHLGGSAASLT